MDLVKKGFEPIKGAQEGWKKLDTYNLWKAIYFEGLTFVNSMEKTIFKTPMAHSQKAKLKKN